MNSSTAKKITMSLVAAAAWFALILQFNIILGNTAQTGFSTGKSIINFFSYFTILSNLLTAVCLTASLLFPSSTWGIFFSRISVQSAITVYIFIVGLVYNLVLRKIWSPAGWQLVADNLLHVVVPLLYVLYWIIFTPRKKLEWALILPWLIFPAFYLLYSLIRGAITNWYPYPFIDAGKLGYGKVAVNALFVLIAFVIVGWGLIAINRSGKKNKVPSKS
jgi:hypothetical protein